MINYQKSQVMSTQYTLLKTRWLRVDAVKILLNSGIFLKNGGRIWDWRPNFV